MPSQRECLLSGFSELHACNAAPAQPQLVAAPGRRAIHLVIDHECASPITAILLLILGIREMGCAAHDTLG